MPALQIVVDWRDTVATAQADGTWTPTPGAQRAIADLVRAGHGLHLDGPWLAKLRPDFVQAWIAQHYPNAFASIGDGKTHTQNVDLRISGQTWRIGRGLGAVSWADFSKLYGEPPPA